MNKARMILLAAALLTASVPAMAMSHVDMKAHDVQCQRDCDMFVKNCGNEVDSLQERIQKLENALQNNGGKYSSDDLRQLTSKLEDARRTLAELTAR